MTDRSRISAQDKRYVAPTAAPAKKGFKGFLNTIGVRLKEKEPRGQGLPVAPQPDRKSRANTVVASYKRTSSRDSDGASSTSESSGPAKPGSHHRNLNRRPASMTLAAPAPVTATLAPKAVIKLAPYSATQASISQAGQGTANPANVTAQTHRRAASQDASPVDKARMARMPRTARATGTHATHGTHGKPTGAGQPDQRQINQVSYCQVGPYAQPGDLEQFRALLSTNRFALGSNQHVIHLTLANGEPTATEGDVAAVLARWRASLGGSAGLRSVPGEFERDVIRAVMGNAGKPDLSLLADALAIYANPNRKALFEKAAQRSTSLGYSPDRIETPKSHHFDVANSSAGALKQLRELLSTNRFRLSVDAAGIHLVEGKPQATKPTVEAVFGWWKMFVEREQQRALLNGEAFVPMDGDLVIENDSFALDVSLAVTAGGAEPDLSLLAYALEIYANPDREALFEKAAQRSKSLRNSPDRIVSGPQAETKLVSHAKPAPAARRNQAVKAEPQASTQTPPETHHFDSANSSAGALKQLRELLGTNRYRLSVDKAGIHLVEGKPQITKATIQAVFGWWQRFVEWEQERALLNGEPFVAMDEDLVFENDSFALDVSRAVLAGGAEPDVSLLVYALEVFQNPAREQLFEKKVAQRKQQRL